MAKLTREEWVNVRATWESDPRDGYAWLIKELNLDLNRVTILKRANKEGWAKCVSLKTIVQRAQRKADIASLQKAKKAKDAKASNEGQEANAGLAAGNFDGISDQKKPNKANKANDSHDISLEKANKVATDAAIDVRAELIETHRAEWSDHREHFPLKDIVAEDGGLNLARTAKTTAEFIRIRQEGERQAWGLDALVEPDMGGLKTMEELDAMFEIAVRRSQEMRAAMKKDREGLSGDQQPAG